MRAECVEPVTHIGGKGYTYCAGHAAARRGVEPTRRMRAWELRWIAEGRSLPSYKPGPEPVTAAPAYVCAECGHSGAGTYVVTVRGDDAEGRTEVCRECDDALRAGAQ